jgi:hypothetical protein
MSAPLIDFELLAVFLDGTATPDERQTVLRLVASSRQAYAELREAAAIREGLHVEVAPAVGPERVVASVAETSALRVAPAPGPKTVRGGTTTRQFRFALPVAMLAAAGLAIVFVQRMQTARPEMSVIALAQAMRVEGATGSGSLAQRFGTQWDAPGWSVMRGSAVPPSLSARAFRAGVRAGLLEMGVGARDTIAIGGAAVELVAMLGHVTGSASIAAQLEDMAHGRSIATSSERARLFGGMRDVMGEAAWFDLGVWIATAQTAARNRQMSFFRANGPGMLALSDLLSRTDVAPPERWNAATRPLRTLLSPAATASNASASIAILDALTTLSVAVGE